LAGAERGIPRFQNKVLNKKLMISKEKLLEDVKILYEDKNILAIDKPAGLLAHSDGRTEEPSLADWMLKHYPEARNVGEPLKLETKDHKIKTILRPGIIHRLDRETSGVMILAKNQKTFEFLKSQFQKREIVKTYHAFVYGKLKADDGVIDWPIGRSQKDFRRRSAKKGARGNVRDAITEFRVMKKNQLFSFVEALPKTGRTHQIRVHFKAIDHPVVCDKLYAPKKECALGFNRLALHAFKIRFKTPDQSLVEVESAYPKDFQNAFNALIHVKGSP
jgi:23S rRNA pseudouridine1911/1915/1917 synthase